MQSLSLTLSKRLSNSKPLFRISSNLVAHASSSTASSPSPPPPLPPIPPPSVLNNLLTAPWSATQSRGISLSGSDVRVGNLIGNRGFINYRFLTNSLCISVVVDILLPGRAHEVLKLYRPCEGTGKATLEVPPHTVAGYATVATTEDDIKRKERKSGLGNETKTKREQLLKVTAAVPLLFIYPNDYSLLLGNFFLFWHLKAGIEEILADYVHHEMTREFVTISLRLFLIIAMKDVRIAFFNL
ncbi:putative mitochondrial protein ymf17, partial [Mucuna pruriens]